VTGNVKLSLLLIKHHVMGYEGVKVKFHSFFTLALDGGEWSASRTICSIPRERAHGIHWTGGSVDTRGGLDAVTKRKNLPPAGN
jgi:hypothetical protein